MWDQRCAIPALLACLALACDPPEDLCAKGEELLQTPGRERDGIDLIGKHCDGSEASAICSRAWVTTVQRQNESKPEMDRTNTDALWFKAVVDFACASGLFPAQDGSLVTASTAVGVPRSIAEFITWARKQIGV